MKLRWLVHFFVFNMFFQVQEQVKQLHQEIDNQSEDNTLGKVQNLNIYDQWRSFPSDRAGANCYRVSYGRILGFKIIFSMYVDIVKH